MKIVVNRRKNINNKKYSHVKKSVKNIVNNKLCNNKKGIIIFRSRLYPMEPHTTEKVHCHEMASKTKTTRNEKHRHYNINPFHSKMQPVPDSHSNTPIEYGQQSPIDYDKYYK